MANFQRKAARLWRETRGNIAVELLKYLGGSSVLSAVWKAISQAVHHSPVDWLLFGGLVLFGVVLIVIAFVVSRGMESVLEPKDGTLPTVRRQPGVAQAPKLQILSAIYGPYKGKGEGVDVTEVLKGLLTSDALAVMINNDIFGDPAIGKAKRLQVSYSYGSPAVVKIERRESDLMVLPEDTFLKEQAENNHAQETTPQPLFTPLQIEAVQLANELKEFHKSLPSYPENAISPDETTERMGELIVEKMVQISAWAGQTGHAYSARFSARVTDFAHRLGAKGIDVSELEQYSESVDITNIVRALRDLTWKIEEP